MVACSSRMAKPEGVWSSCGSGFSTTAVVDRDSGGGWSGILGIAARYRVRVVLSRDKTDGDGEGKVLGLLGKTRATTRRECETREKKAPPSLLPHPPMTCSTCILDLDIPARQKNRLRVSCENLARLAAIAIETSDQHMLRHHAYQSLPLDSAGFSVEVRTRNKRQMPLYRRLWLLAPAA